MITKKKLELVIFALSALLLVFLYRFSLYELLRRIVEWSFVGLGFSLLVEYLLIEGNLGGKGGIGGEGVH